MRRWRVDMESQIKDIREKMGFNRTEFAAHFGIPLRTVEDWEAGRRTPPEYIPRLIFYQWKYEQLINRPKITNAKITNGRNVSIIKDTDGNKIVVIHDIIFRNKQNISWDDVENYLERYVGEIYKIAEDDEVIYIGKDLPDEYAHSRYSAKLKGTLAKAKANVAQAIPELIEISSNKTFNENLEGKHQIDAKFGWYRYDSRFAIAVYDNDGEIKRYNMFKARMIIRHDADGKKYLYDIINIKKEPSTPLG